MQHFFVPIVAVVVVETDANWVNVPRQNVCVSLIVQVAYWILIESRQVRGGKKG